MCVYQALLITITTYLVHNPRDKLCIYHVRNTFVTCTLPCLALPCLALPCLILPSACETLLLHLVTLLSSRRSISIYQLNQDVFAITLSFCLLSSTLFFYIPLPSLSLLVIVIFVLILILLVLLFLVLVLLVFDLLLTPRLPHHL